MLALSVSLLFGDDSDRVSSPGILLGYKGVGLDGYTFSHDTHPNDPFLMNSGQPGSAGETKLDDPLHFLAVGLTYDVPLGKSWTVAIGAGGLFIPNRDEHQNDNDTRPAENGAFVYSEANFGVFATVGLSYDVTKRCYVGIEGQVAGIFVESGWDRFNSDERVHSSTEWVPSIGPKIGYWVNEHFLMEVGVQFGHSVGGTVSLRYRF